jgi:hypothetical protein
VERLARSPCREPTTVLHRARFDVGLANSGLRDPATVQRLTEVRLPLARSTLTFANGYLHVDEAGFLNRSTELGFR